MGWSPSMLHLLRSFIRLTAAERRSILHAARVVAGFRLALWTRPLSQVTAAAPSTRRSSSDFTSADRLAWAVRATARRIPGATCLTRALAARWLLAENGVPSEIRYGWRKDKAGRLHAHAWLECSGRVLIGGDEDLGSYTTFSTPVAAPPSR